MVKATIGVLCVLLVAAAANAAFIVEPQGLASANYSGNTASTSIVGLAPGLSGAASIYGGSGTDPTTDPDLYTFSYTPGTDVDNWFPTKGTDLGNGNTATGEAGGGSGNYYVYITGPATTNVNAAGARVTAQSDAGNVFVPFIDMNNTPIGPGTFNDVWLYVGKVALTAGNTYTVAQAANSTAFVSQRSSGVMWEAVPEPATMSLLGMAGLAFLLRRRR